MSAVEKQSVADDDLMTGPGHAGLLLKIDGDILSVDARG